MTKIIENYKGQIIEINGSEAISFLNGSPKFGCFSDGNKNNALDKIKVK